MKKKYSLIVFSIIIAVMMYGCGNSGGEQKTNDSDLKGTITISGAFALYPMALKWAEEFQKLHPQVRIEVSAGGAGKGMTDALSGMVNLGMVSREISDEELAKGAWFVGVTKDAVVPVINSKNPYLTQLESCGITKEELECIYISGVLTHWKRIDKSIKGNDKINPYTRADACGAADVWAKYLGKKQEDLLGIAVSGDPGITEAIKNDILGIGYNNICYAYDSKTKKPNEGIAIIPIDINNNRKMDENESFYETKDSIIKAIVDGRYPSPPARDLYFVSKNKPEDEAVIEFLKWILTDGQKFVPEAGYITLSDEKIKLYQDKLR